MSGSISRRRVVAAVAGAMLLPVRAGAAPKSVPTPDIPHSRGLGITLAEWKTLHGKPAKHDELSVTYTLDAMVQAYEVTLYAVADAEQIHDIDISFSQPPTAGRATMVIASVLPVDSVKTGETVPDPDTDVAGNGTATGWRQHSGREMICRSGPTPHRATTSS